MTLPEIRNELLANQAQDCQCANCQLHRKLAAALERAGGDVSDGAENQQGKIQQRTGQGESGQKASGGALR